MCPVIDVNHALDTDNVKNELFKTRVFVFTSRIIDCDIVQLIFMQYQKSRKKLILSHDFRIY